MRCQARSANVSVTFMSALMAEADDPALALSRLAESQAGIVARRQLRDLDVSRRVVLAHLRARRWQRVHPETYATFTGLLPDLARVWAGLLYAGKDAVASHGTAAWLDGLQPDCPPVVDACVPHGHRHRACRPDVRVRQSRHHSTRHHPARLPPRARIEETVLDLTDETRSADRAITVVLRACQQRLTTASRLRERARARSRLRWRALLKDVLADVESGVLSTLERRYDRDVERAHGLPRGTRNCSEGSGTTRRYRDVRYHPWGVVVELDGRAAHPQEWRERDDLRDNDLVEGEDTRTLRYGWVSTASRSCETAAQVAAVLRHRGWTGTLRSCGANCTAG